MFNSDVKNKLSEKREYDSYLLREVLQVYLYLLLFVKDSKEIRNNLICFYNDNKNYSILEKDILKIIKRTKENDELSELLISVMDDIEDTFFKLFNYNEYILNGYYEAIEMNDIFRAVVPKKEFKLLTEEDKKKLVYEIKK